MVELVFVTDGQIRSYYRKFFGKNCPTDVIAFPLQEKFHLGCIMISIDTAHRQAREAGHSLWEEIRFLIVHGLLHLVGFDHAKPREAKLMRAKEGELLEGVSQSGE